MAFFIEEVKSWFGFLSVLALFLYPVGLLAWNCFENRSAERAKDESKLAQDEEKKPPAPASSASWSLVPLVASLLVWPGICVLPLALSLGGLVLGYEAVFPATWYDVEPVQPAIGSYGVADPRTIKPLGLVLGILAVAIGQVVILAYHWLRRASWLGSTTCIQQKERVYLFGEGLMTHLAQPEGFVLIGGYLAGTWMLGWMPASYYSFTGGIHWGHVAAQLLLQDLFQYLMHLGEHKVSAWVYAMSHKPHHRFTNPRLFDAFDGSVTDTMLMIILPFVVVARLVPANVWSYMTFGALYANWLVLIHSEYVHPWDGVFRMLGFGTAADHHVHHKFFVFNYAHLFMYWDKLFGTYRDPSNYAGKHFNKEV